MSDAISVRLSDRSEVTQHKINFIKNCPKWGLTSQPPDHQSNALPDPDPEVVSSNPTGAIFYFVLCNFISVRKSDRNASDRPIVKNSKVTICFHGDGNHEQYLEQKHILFKDKF